MFYAVVRAVLRLLLRIFTELEVEGTEHVPSGPALMVCNHVNLMDPVVPIAVLKRRVTFMAKEEVFATPFLGPILRALQVVPVARGRIASRRALQRAEEFLRRGWLFCMYPEGTRSRRPGMGPGHAGAALLALRTGVPIVPAAILFDLAVGDASTRPDAAMGYAACQSASDGPVAEGNAGAGTGATVGKLLGMSRCMKGGLGTAGIALGGGLVVGAIVAVNALGDVVDPKNGRIIAGTRAPLGPGLADTLALMRRVLGRAALAFSHTVIGVVATNAALDVPQANFVAGMAHDGIARVIRPAHTLLDGDTLFCLATGPRRADVNLIGAYAAEAVAEAILRGVRAARSIPGIPAASDLEA